METSSPTPPPSPQRPVVEFLRRYLDMAEKGEVQSVVLGYIKSDGGAAMQSTPMSAIMMNHLSTLLERRVNREYDRAIAQAAGPGRQSTGVGAVPEKPRVEAVLPRNVRRQIEKRNAKQQKATSKVARKKQAAENLVRAAIPPAANGQASAK